MLNREQHTIINKYNKNILIIQVKEIIIKGTATFLLAVKKITILVFGWVFKNNNHYYSEGKNINSNTISISLFYKKSLTIKFGIFIFAVKKITAFV